MADRFRLATFNLENLGDGDGFAARQRLLTPQLERLDADILCLQEVNGRDRDDGSRDLGHLDALLEDTPYAGYERAMTLSSSGNKPRDKHNLVVLSRFPIAATRQIRHELVVPPSYRIVTGGSPAKTEKLRWARPLLQLTLTLDNGRALHLINLHLRSRLASPIPGRKTGPFSWETAGAWAEGAYLSAIKRNGQALEARLAVDAIFDADPEALVAVCGDLNAEADEIATEILRADTDNTGSPDLAERVLALLRAGGAETTASMLHHGRAMQPDHILVSRQLLGHYRGIETHNELLHDEWVALATGAGSAESYHAPLVASFTMPAKTG
jgi:hypothetical protein